MSDRHLTSSTRAFLHKGISRLQAEQLLVASRCDGSFLVRESETIQGAYTLCLLHQGKVHQYRILPDDQGKIFVQAEKGVQQRKFVDLVQLIHEYIHRGDKNGLVCGLTKPIPCQDAADETKEESDDDEGPPHYTSLPQCSSSSTENKTLTPTLGLSSTSQYQLPQALAPPGGPSQAQANGASGLVYENTGSGTHTQPPSGHFLVRHMQARFSQLDLSDFDGMFIDDLRKYIDEYLLYDEHAITHGGENMNHLRKLMGKAARDLDRQMELYFAKLDAIRHLFGPITTPPLSTPASRMQAASQEEVNLQALSDRLGQCRKAVSHLEKKASRKLKELSERDGEEDYSQVDDSAGVPSVPLRRSPSVRPVIPATAFEAKLMKLGKHSKVKLTVDIQSGKLFSVKPSKDVLDESNVFTHDKIEQLIKNSSNNNRLDIKVQGRKKETYLFENVRDRENFCQLVQQLKNMHSVTQEVENLSVFVGTWNMGEGHPPWNLGNWLKSQGLGKSRCPTLALIPHDLYVIGTQESALNEKDWTNKLKAAMMDYFALEMHTVAVVSLWAIRIVVLVKPEFKHKITNIQHSSVKTGIANALGNKGAVGVSFNFNGTSFCFINCHLTSGHERNARRIANFRDIIKGLSLRPKGPRSLFDITNQFHHMFFLGDLNFRLEDMDPQEIIKKITQEKNYPCLLEYDQFRRTQNSKQAFVGFCEEEILFPPTYRIEKGTTNHYIWQKFKKTGTRINAPSWCDRIVWRSYPDTYIRNASYGSVETILTSDHKPVFAAFDIGIQGQFVSSKGASADSSGDMKIIFEEIHVEVKTSGREYFKIEFHSNCLEEPVLSQQNCLFGAHKPDMCLPQWSKADLPQLQPIFDNRDYLEDQHLLLAVKTVDGMESYGECVLALKSMFGIKAQKFSCPLLHIGEETGYIRGRMYVKAKDGTPASLNVKKSRRSYELIYMDTDSLFIGDKEGTLSQAASLRMQKPALQASRSFPIFDQESLSGDVERKRPESKERKSNPNNLRSSSAEGKELVPKQPVANPRKTPRMGQSALGQSTSVLSVATTASQSTPAVGTAPVPAPRSPPACTETTATATVPKQRSVESLATSPPQQKKALDTSSHSSSSCTSLSNTPPSKISPADMHTYSNQPVITTPPEDGPVTIRPQSLVRRHGVRESLVSIRDHPVYGEEGVGKNRHSQQSGSSDEPPTPPPRRYLSNEDTSQPQYEVLKGPSSINEWLLNLGLPQYISAFFNNGWDKIELLGNVTDSDLKHMDVCDSTHRDRILKSIQDMHSSSAV